MDDIKFRDQCAIEIFKELIREEGSLIGSIIDSELNTMGYDDSYSSVEKENWEAIDKLCNMSYKIADSMRKSRMKVFK